MAHPEGLGFDFLEVNLTFDRALRTGRTRYGVWRQEIATK